MVHDPIDAHRRALLFFTGGLLVGRPALAAPVQGVSVPAVAGKAGDFHFLAGEWRVVHRRMKPDKTWDNFEGGATCWDILEGNGSVEELRIPARDFSGMGLRLLSPKSQLWEDYWVSGKERAIGEPGLTGSFVDSVGTFKASDTTNGTTTVYRGVWDQITPRSHRWRQGVSRDGGTTWDDTWFMNWTRIG